MNSKKSIQKVTAKQHFAENLKLPPAGHAQHFAVFCHGLSFQHGDVAAYEVIRELTDRGIGVLPVDLTGKLPPKEGPITLAFPAILETVISATSWLENEYKHPELLIGHSIGALSVLCAAPGMPELRAVAVIGCPFPYSPEKEFEGTLSVKINKYEVNIIDLPKEKSFLKRIKGMEKALLILHSPQDAVIEIESARQLYDMSMHPKSFISMDGGDHFLSSRQDAAYAGKMICHWAGRYLANINESIPETAEPVLTQTGDDGYTTRIVARNHYLLGDEPEDVGGNDRGPTPYELLLSALGTCTGITLKMYAGRKKWPLKNVIVSVAHAKVHEKDCLSCDENDTNIARITRKIDLNGNLTEEQRKRLMEIANRCPVHQTLNGQITIETEAYSST